MLPSTGTGEAHVTSTDVRRILGELDDAKVMAVLAFKPNVADLEAVAVCMAGDHDILAKSGHHVPVTAARIVELLAQDEEEPRER